MPESLHAYRADPFSYPAARAIAEELGLSEPVAITLVRRGYGTPEEARAFLAADESHAPSEFDGMGEVVARILAAIEAGRRITVHGDFDVDGVCATAIAVRTLRGLGAECDWLIPDRLGDGYGLSSANVERLAQRGTGLLLTVDCGITAAEEVRAARELGIEVIVTDHHQPGPALPECRVLHPVLSGYPFEELCGTGVAWKLSIALREAAGGGAEPSGGGAGEAGGPDDDLDLVALATVADVVPLVGENRTLVRRGLEVARRARRPGLRALMEVARCDPTRLDEGDLAFRLAPRINAAGRLYRADAGVELLLAGDEERAAQIARELDRANHERRAAEREVEAAAEAARRALPEGLRKAPGMVLAGEGWHPGVIGIVASRLAERHYRPVVVVSLDGEGGGRGSGRSIPGFDLLAALEACAPHLERFGGHRAAAGLELRAEALDAFREAFAAHATEVLGPDGARRTERIDAMVGGSGIGLELAEEMERLAPFGMGNPGVRLLVPSARVRDVRPMGEGRHARFSLHSGAHRALGVAFGRSTLGVGDDEAVDAAVRLEVNHWNGSVEPRIVLRELYPLGGDGDGAARDGDSSPAAAAAHAHACEGADEHWWSRFEAELEAAPAGESPPTPADGAPARTRISRRADSASAALAELVSSGERVLVVAADASRRAGFVAGAAGLARFAGQSAAIVCGCCGEEASATLADPGGPPLALVDWDVLARAPGLAAAFEHLVAIDPPAFPEHESPAHAGPRAGGGFLHELWSGTDLAAAVLERRLAQRPEVAAIFRALREHDGGGAEAALTALRGGGPHLRPPEVAARCLRVLAELALVDSVPRKGDPVPRVVSSEGTDLARSAAFRAYRSRFEEGQRYLERHRHP